MKSGNWDRAFVIGLVAWMAGLCGCSSISNNPITFRNADKASVVVRSIGRYEGRADLEASFTYKPGVEITVRIPDDEYFNFLDKHELIVVNGKCVGELIIPAMERPEAPITLIYRGCPDTNAIQLEKKDEKED